MTCIVGLECHGGLALLGADSALSADGVLSLMRRPKVWSRGRVAFGHAGTVRAGNVVECTTLPDYEGGDVYRYVVCDLVPAIADALSGAELSFEEDEMLVAVAGEVYCIDGAMGVHRCCGFAAIGDAAGAQAALGALSATEGGDPHERVRAALVAAERFCTSVRAPWHVVAA